MIESEIRTDPATDALDRLTDAAAAGANELHLIEHDLTAIQKERRRGRTWRQIMSVSGVLKPLSGMVRVAADLGAASGSFRRALAKALRSEGMQVNAIADNFGVSRQRVSTLVRPEANSDAEA